MDEPVDRLNRNMYREVVDLPNDPHALEWGIRMNLVSRQLPDGQGLGSGQGGRVAARG